MFDHWIEYFYMFWYTRLQTNTNSNMTNKKK